jgi:hypothetical protein
LIVLALVFFASVYAAPVSAATGTCTVTPSVAPTGTTLDATCSGLTPNQTANTYLVEPDGRTQTGCEAESVFTAPCNPKADASGNVSFSIVTAEPKDEGFGALGTWTVVADNPGGASAVGSFSLTGNGQGVSGATLTITLTGPNTWLVSGSGFGPGEIVNGWFDVPSNCSGSEHPGISTTVMSQDDYRVPFPKADSAGNVSFTFCAAQFDTEAAYCTGTYQLTLRGLASGNGASAWFTVTGNRISPYNGSSIQVVVGATVDGVFYNGSTIAPAITIIGTNFPPFSGINCWATRPDGRVFPWEEGGRIGTDAGGNFSVSGFVGAVGDSFELSTEPGVWAMTCATPSGAALGEPDNQQQQQQENGIDSSESVAITTFTLNALPIDP